MSRDAVGRLIDFFEGQVRRYVDEQVAETGAGNHHAATVAFGRMQQARSVAKLLHAELERRGGKDEDG